MTPSKFTSPAPTCPQRPPRPPQMPVNEPKQKPKLIRRPALKRYAPPFAPPSVSSDRSGPLPFPFDGATLISSLALVVICQSGCWPQRPGELAGPEVEILGVRPSADVGPTDVVAIAFSQPVSLAQERWPIAVHSDGAQLAPQISFGAGGVNILLAPREPWPAGKKIIIELTEGLIDQTARTIGLPSQTLSFETRPAEARAPELALRYPPMGRDVPLNLRWIALVSSGFDALPRQIVLERDTQQITADVMRAGESGVLLARLPEHRAPCDPLCPGSRYTIALEGVPEARGEVRTATIADSIPPTVTATAVIESGDGITFQVDTSEPVLLTARLLALDGTETPIDLPLVASACTFVEPPADALAPENDYTLIVDGEDIAGNSLRTIEISFRVAPRIDVEINELVPTPAHDWNDTEGGGTAFDARPGIGSITENDEWIELVNRSTFPIDLRTAGLILRVHDMTPTETIIDGAKAMYFGDGGSRFAWWPGEAMVFHARGTIATRGFTLELLSGTRLLDSVVVGESADAIALNGTPPELHYEALARDQHGHFRWCLPSPGDPLAPTDCAP
jgi:hypothetical protein